MPNKEQVRNIFLLANNLELYTFLSLLSNLLYINFGELGTKKKKTVPADRCGNHK